jgi:hypothetical protein
MGRNQPQASADAPYSYGQIEHALAQVFGIDAAGQKGWLRGRLQHVRRLGLVADSPGRGRTIDYALDDADKWLVAIELEHFGQLGADPTKVVELIKRVWNPPARKRSASEAVARGEASLRDLVAVARASRRRDTDLILTVRFEAMATPAKVFGYVTASGMPSLIGWLAGDRVDPTPRRASIFNLSERLRQFDKALAEAVKLQAEAPISDTAQQILDMGAVARGQMSLKEFRTKHRGKRSK